MPTDDHSAANQFSFSAFGVRVGIRTDDPAMTVTAAERLTGLFPGGVDLIAHELADHIYEIRQPKHGWYEIFKGPHRVTRRKESS